MVSYIDLGKRGTNVGRMFPPPVRNQRKTSQRNGIRQTSVKRLLIRPNVGHGENVIKRSKQTSSATENKENNTAIQPVKLRGVTKSRQKNGGTVEIFQRISLMLNMLQLLLGARSKSGKASIKNQRIHNQKRRILCDIEG